MKNEQIKKLYDKKDKLEINRIEYLEVDNNVAARRIERQIKEIELRINLYKFNKVRQELDVYKDIVKNYPELQNRINTRLKINDN